MNRFHTYAVTRFALMAVILMSMLAGFVVASSTDASAHIPMFHSVIKPERPDSVDSLDYYKKKHFWRASAEVVGMNLGLWAFDRFIQKGDFAYISFNTIKENFRHGLIWDNDKLGTNTFLHPYNGNLYYNAARSNGFNFWQSELFAIGGSFMWEFFMEREYPSTNDFIATPIGGAAIGEMLFRASDALIDNRTTGIERFEREAGVFILSPLRGFNRIISGEAWRISPSPGRLFGRPPFAVRISAGLKMLACNGHYGNLRPGFAAHLDLEYGDRFEIRSTKPYDYFTVKSEVQIMKKQPFLTMLEIKGRLLAREIFDDYTSQGSIGLYQHFDFYDSDTIQGMKQVPYKLGIPACVGGGFMFRTAEKRQWVLQGFAHANAVILGSILSDHYQTDERNYNWASGFSLKGGLSLILKRDFLSVIIAHKYYRLFSWRGYRVGTDLSDVDFRTLNVMGDKSVASFNISDIRLDMRLVNRLYATFAFTNYLRSTHYRDFPDVKSNSANIRIMLSYKL